MRAFRSDLESGWVTAVKLLETYLRRPRKWEALIKGLPENRPVSDRRKCQFLLLGVLRNMTLIASAIEWTVPKDPRTRLKSILFLTLAEVFLDRRDKRPQVVSAAVERSKTLISARETGFVNAVVRRASEMLDAGTVRENTPDEVSFRSIYYSHPGWLVERWHRRWGEDYTKKLLEWNQRPAHIYLRVAPCWRPEPPCDWAETRWRGYFRWIGTDWNSVKRILNAGKGYVSDPSSSRPIDLLDPRPGESVLDLCASPGGKSCAIRERLGTDERSQLVAVDLPGRRSEVLRENLDRREGANARVHSGDILRLTATEISRSGLPRRYSCVLLDAPCSNTGVLRRRPDAKWRLEPADIAKAAKLQLCLLSRASDFVKPAGRLVYSTCSVETEENGAVVEKFLDRVGARFKLVDAHHYNPVSDGHDGGSAFLFQSDTA